MSSVDGAVLDRRLRFGQRLRELRRHRGLTQEQLAHAVGVDRKLIYRTELGIHSTVVDHVFTLADALGVSEADLFSFGADRKFGTGIER